MVHFDAMSWKRMLAYVTGSVDEELLARNEYPVDENRGLRRQIQGRIGLTDPERISLASVSAAKRLGWAKGNSGIDQSWKEPGFEQTADHPVVKVSWDDAQTFCAWLTKKERGEGKIKGDQIYRLPTDAEWSVAVGLEGEAGGTPKDKNMKIKGVFPWGTQWPPPKGAGNYDKRLEADDYIYTSPVGSFKANQHGLYDMGGNVWQWCEDWYDGAQTSRVLRGASWDVSVPDFLLSSCRFINLPDYRNFIIGFRCVLVGGGSL